MEIFHETDREVGLDNQEISEALLASIEGKELKNVLILPPDYTRYHSNAGYITNYYYHMLVERGCNVDILPAVGTHEAVSQELFTLMFGDIPYEKMIVHNWRKDTMEVGEITADFMKEITNGLWETSIKVEINKLVMNSKYDLILSIGQVVPHEVIGMANHAKNLFIGVGGSEMINKSHMVGAVYGIERIMGRDHTPVRKICDYAFEHFLKERPILFVLTVTTAPQNKIITHGLYISENRIGLEKAIVQAQKYNFDFVEKPLKKCVVYLDPFEFQSTWLGNKSIYRTRLAMADGGELIILAPGISKFGEDDICDELIQKYGYAGRLKILEYFKNNQDLQDNMSAAAHLIHGSSDGRFTVTYAVDKISKEKITSVHFNAADYHEMIKRYDPKKLSYGVNILPDEEEIYFIPNPALGLWSSKEKF